MSETQQALDAYESAAAVAVETMCRRIGYGRMQQIIGDLWEKARDCAPRGRMGVTVDDALPPIPKAAHMRRSHRAHGGYEMVPAYTVAELKAFAHEAIKRDRLERDGDLRADGIKRWVSNDQPCDVAKETNLWRCTVCGRIGTVARCCGEETREPVRAPNG